MVILLAQTTVQLPSEAIGDRQPRANLPIILSVQSTRLLPYVAVRIAEIAIGLLCLSEQQFLQRANHVLYIPEAKCRTRAIAQAVGVCGLIVSAEFYTVIALHPAEMLRPVIGLIRPGGNRIALHSPDVSAISEG